MRRREYLLWAALLLAGCLWLTGFARAEKKWEYMVVDGHNFEGAVRLNGAGEQGWELVAVAAGPSSTDPRTFYFKRAK